MASISSPGIGSNLDVNGIISQLMAVERAPLTKLAQKEAGFQARLSAIGTLKSAVSSLQSAISALTSSSKFAATKRATIGDSTALSVTTSNVALTGSYAVKINTLAESQKLKTNTFAAATSTLGSGTLTIEFGATADGAFVPNAKKAALTIDIDPSKSSLLDVRDAVNQANGGVSASIVNDGTGYRLSIVSRDTGVSNSLKITAADDDGNHTDASGLSQLLYDPLGTQRLAVSQPAADASVDIDGIAITSASNTISDAIGGITLNLLKAGVTSSVSISNDSSGVRTAVEGFVKAYNDASKTLKDLGAYNAETKEAGPLQGDATLRMIQSQMRSMLSGKLSFVGGGLSNLSEIGISFQRDGSIKLDGAKLDKVLSDPSKDIATLFASVAKSSDRLISVTSADKSTLPGSYPVLVSQLARQGRSEAALAFGTDITIAAGATLAVSVDGVSTSIALSGGTYNAAGLKNLAAEIQSKLNGSSAFSGKDISVGVVAEEMKAKVNSTFSTGTVNAGNDQFDLTIKGVTHSITLTQGDYDETALAAEIQSKVNTAFAGDGFSVAAKFDATNGLTVSLNESVIGDTISLAVEAGSNLLADSSLSGVGRFGLDITSSSYGSPSQVQNMALSSGATNYLTAAAVSIAGKDVIGTIGSVSATGEGQNLVATGAASGLKLKVSGGSASGFRGTVSFEAGFAVQLDRMLGQMLASKGTISGKIDSINDSVKRITQQSEALERRMTQIEARYRRQFTNLDMMMSDMTRTSSYLTQQLANLPKIG